MTKYECKCCNLTTTQHANYLRHLNTPKHKKEESIKSQPVEPIQFEPKKDFLCDACNQRFSFKQSMYKHIKYRCKNKDNSEELKEILNLMKKKLQQKDLQFELQQKQIDKIMIKLDIN